MKFPQAVVEAEVPVAVGKEEADVVAEVVGEVGGNQGEPVPTVE